MRKQIAARASVWNRDVKHAILAAARSMFPRSTINASYDQGHWWIHVVEMTEREISNSQSFGMRESVPIVTYNVIDDIPGVNGSGFNFERH